MDTNLNQTIETQKLIIKETITKTVSENIDKEITLPYFFREKKDSGYFFAIVDSETMIRVDLDSRFEGIILRPVSCNKEAVAKGVEISMQEFDEAYDQALSIVTEHYLKGGVK